MIDSNGNEIKLGDTIVYIWQAVMRTARVLDVQENKILVLPAYGDRHRWIFSSHHVALYRDKVR